MGADPMSLFGLDWAAGTHIGEALKAQREARRVERERSLGSLGFYVPADLTALNADGPGVKKGRAN